MHFFAFISFTGGAEEVQQETPKIQNRTTGSQPNAGRTVGRKVWDENREPGEVAEKLKELKWKRVEEVERG